MRSSAGQSGGAYDYSISLATLLQITKRLNARDETLDVDYWQGLLKRLTVQAQPRTLHVARAGLDCLRMRTVLRCSRHTARARSVLWLCVFLGQNFGAFTQSADWLERRCSALLGFCRRRRLGYAKCTPRFCRSGCKRSSARYGLTHRSPARPLSSLSAGQWLQPHGRRTVHCGARAATHARTQTPAQERVSSGLSLER
jgi:hypothetical protein